MTIEKLNLDSTESSGELSEKLQEIGEDLRSAEKAGNEELYLKLEKVEKELRQKYEEVLNGEELLAPLNNYEARLAELRRAVSQAETAQDEAKVLELESEIYESEQQKALYVAQLSAMDKEEESSEQTVINLNSYLETREQADDLIDEVGEIMPDDGRKISRMGLNLSWRERMSSRLRRASLIAMTFLSALGGMKPSEAQNSGSRDPVTMSTDSIPMSSETSVESDKTIPWNPLRDWRFHLNAMMERDPDTGKIWGISPQAALIPLFFETTRTETEEGQAVYNLPYEYARQFDLSPEAKKNLNPGDYEKLQESVKQEMEQSLADHIGGLSSQIFGEDGLSERRIRGVHGHEEESKLNITSIKITGYASPEGRNTSGAESSPIVDVENIRLATTRAAGGLEVLKSFLEERGISEEEFNQVLTQVSGEEDQFSSQEITRLTELAQGEQGIADDEKILNLIKKYNAGEVGDPEVRKELDGIVASKRRVEFQIDYENEASSRYAIPIPLFLLLLPIIPRLRRKRRSDEEDQESVVTEDSNELPGVEPIPPLTPPVRLVPSEDLIVSEPIQPPTYPPHKTGNVHEGIKVPKYIEDNSMWERESDEYRKNQTEAYVNDLWVFFDETESIRKKVDYRDMCEGMLLRYDEFVGDDSSKDRELFLTHTILSAWREHDLISRRDAGWSNDTIDVGLDYENNGEQIRWARMHARALMYLVESKRDNPDVDYLEILEKRSASFLEESYARALAEKRKNRTYRHA